jgi:hypothetical protein
MKRNLVLASACVLACLAIAQAASAAQPTFYARRDYADSGRWVAVADTNGDGIPDLIELAGGQGSVEVQFGNGNGTFRQGPKTLTGLGDVLSFGIADLSGNKTVDLVLVGQNQNHAFGIGVSLGNGDGTFQPAVFYPAGTDTYTDYLALGDFNGDGSTDVVTVGNQGIWLFTGKGGGTFNPGVLIPFNGAGPMNANVVAAADFRKDGKLDLVLSTPTGFAVLLGNGNGTFQPQQDFANPQRTGVGCGFVVGSIASGGYPAIVGNCAFVEQVPLYLSNGKGGFSWPIYADMPGEAVAAIADVNGDGIPDLISAYGNVALGEGHAKFKPPVYYPLQDTASGTGPWNVVAAHLRSANLMDLVFQGSGAVSVLLNVGNKGFEDGRWTALPSTSPCGASADFNGDGRPDLALSTGQGISILLGTGSASSPFKLGTPIALSGDSACLVTGDLNGDHIPDLLVPSANPDAMNAYLGKGDGTFALKSSTPLPAVGFVAVADFNQDGKLDFATSANLWALGNGDGTFQTPVPLVANPPETGFNNIAAGDVNGDGWPDLVLTSGSEATATIWVLLNNQHGGFTQSTILTCQNSFTTPCDPSEVLLADLNGDGNLDLIVGEVSLGGVVVYLGDGHGGFTQKQALNDALAAPGPIMVGDVNGDGIPDIGLSEAGTVAIFLGKGDGTFYAPFYIGAGPNPGDILPLNLHGQSVTAGLPDLVAPDYTGGVMVLINTTK